MTIIAQWKTPSPRFVATLLCAASLLILPIPKAQALPPKKAKFEDVCAPLRKPFDKIKNLRRDKAIGGALKGALAGLVLGTVNNMGKPKERQSSVLPWMAVGAVAGGVVGYVQSKAEQASTRDELQRVIANDFNDEVAAYSPMPQMIMDLGNCRRDQIYSVEVAKTSGEIDTTEGMVRLKKLEEWNQKDEKAIADAAAMQQSRISYYIRAQRLAEGAPPEQTESEEQNFAQYSDAKLIPAVYVRKVENMSDVQVAPPVAAPVELFVSAKSGVGLRETPDSAAKKLGAIPYRAKISGTPASTEGWYATQWNGISGFVPALYVDAKAPAPIVKPEPARGVRRMTLAKTNADRSTPRRQAQYALASGVSAKNVRAQNSSSTAAQFEDLRKALT